MSRSSILVAFLSLATAPAYAQLLPQPAEEHDAPAQPAKIDPDTYAPHQRSWEAHDVGEYASTTVTEGIREEERIGVYKQPRWTANRRFPTTRIYVLPAGNLNFEYWFTPKIALDGSKPVVYKSMYEVEMGLGHHLQLDLYFTTLQNDLQGPILLHEEKVELRWALADWGVIAANPTLYVEYVRASAGSPKVEAKLLLGNELAPRWHWGVNLVYEHAFLGSKKKNEYALAAGLSYAAIDMKVSVGAELQAKAYDHAGNRFDMDTYSLTAGPSLQWRPVPPMRFLVVALFGASVNRAANVTTPVTEPTAIASWEF